MYPGHSTLPTHDCLGGRPLESPSDSTIASLPQMDTVPKTRTASSTSVHQRIRRVSAQEREHRSDTPATGNSFVQPIADVSDMLPATGFAVEAGVAPGTAGLTPHQKDEFTSAIQLRPVLDGDDSEWLADQTGHSYKALEDSNDFADASKLEGYNSSFGIRRNSKATRMEFSENGQVTRGQQSSSEKAEGEPGLGRGESSVTGTGMSSDSSSSASLCQGGARMDHLHAHSDRQHAIKSGISLTVTLTISVAVVALACISPWSLESGLALLVGGGVAFLFGYFGLTLRSRPLFAIYLAIFCILLAGLLVAVVFNCHLAIQSFRAVHHVYFDNNEEVSAPPRRRDMRRQSVHASAADPASLSALPTSPAFAATTQPSVTYSKSSLLLSSNEQLNTLEDKQTTAVALRKLALDKIDAVPKPPTFVKPDRGPFRGPYGGKHFSLPRAPQFNETDSTLNVHSPVIRVEAKRCSTVPLSLTRYIHPTQLQLQTYGLLCGFSLHDMWGVFDSWDVDCENFCGFKYLATKRYIWNVGTNLSVQYVAEETTPEKAQYRGAATWIVRGSTLVRLRLPAGTDEQRTFYPPPVTTAGRKTSKAIGNTVSVRASQEREFETWLKNLSVEDQIKCMEHALDLTCGVVKTFYLALLPGLSVIMVVMSVALVVAGIPVIRQGVRLTKQSSW